MKKICLGLSLMMSVVVGQAQFTLEVSGSVLDGTDPVYGQWVYWATAESSRSVLTDSSGEFFFTDTLTGAFGEAEIYIIDCVNDTILFRPSYIQNLATALEFDFQYCDTTENDSIYLLSGQVNWGGFPFSDDAVQVWLYEHDTSSNQLSAKDSLYSVSGNYFFDDLENGSYLIRAAMVPNSIHESVYMPTYLGGGLFWQDGVSSVLAQSDFVNPDLMLLELLNTNGPGAIEGFVQNNSNGVPLANVSLLVLDDQDVPVAYDRSNPNGSFAIEYLPAGTYKVYAEVPGKMAYPATVQLNEQNQFQSNQNFTVDPYQTMPAGAATSVDMETQDLIRLFPNPTQGKLILELDSPFGPDSWIQLWENGGRLIRQIENENIVGKSRYELDLMDLPRGVYYIQIMNQSRLQYENVYLN